MSDISIGSVHSPQAMNTISIRGRGKKVRNMSLSDVNEYAKEKKITFVQAFNELTSKLYKEGRDE